MKQKIRRRTEIKVLTIYSVACSFIFKLIAVNYIVKTCYQADVLILG